MPTRSRTPVKPKLTPTAPVIPKTQAEAIRTAAQPVAAVTVKAPTPPVPQPTAAQTLQPVTKRKVRLRYGFKLYCPTQDRLLFPGVVTELEEDAWVRNQLQHSCLELVD